MKIFKILFQDTLRLKNLTWLVFIFFSLHSTPVMATLLQYYPYNSYTGNSGWLTQNKEFSNPSTICGVDESELVFRFIAPTGLLIPLSDLSGYIKTFNTSTGEITSEVTFPSVNATTTQRVCLTPLVEGYMIFLDEDLYHDFYASMYVNDLGIYGVSVALKFASEPYEYYHMAPTGAVNADPTFVLNFSPAQSSNIVKTDFAVYEYDPLVNVISSPISVFSLGNAIPGSGIKELGKANLSNGLYVWAYQIVNSANQFSGFSGFDWPFIIDTVPPTPVSEILEPNQPTSASTIRINLGASDSLSGVNEILLYVDGVVHTTCQFASSHNAECIGVIEPYNTESEHTYFSVYKDTAGNTATSSPQSFSVIEPVDTPDLIVSNLSPAANTILNGNGVVTFQGSVQNLSEVDIAEGGFVRLEIDWDSDGGPPDGSPYDIAYTIPNPDIRMGPFVANEAKVFSHMVTDLPPGVHLFRFGADVSNEVNETNEGNNFSEWSTFRIISGILNATPNTINGGVSVSIAWDVDGADGGVVPDGSRFYQSLECSVEGRDDLWSWYGNNADTRTSAPLSSDTTFTLSCDTVLLDSKTVVVNTQPGLSIVPRIVPRGETATIFWNTHNNDEGACTLKNGPDTIDYIPTTSGDPNTGYADITVEGRSRYTLECPGGSTLFEVEIVQTAYEI